MAEKTVKVSIIVSDDGTMRLTEKSAKRLSGNLEKTGKAAKTADRNLKGVAQASSNSTKNFSKMAQGITGGLVPAYATLAANVFAVTALFAFLKDAGDLRVLQDGQISYASTTGQALNVLTDDIRKAAGGLLNYKDAAQAAAIGVASGLQASQITELAEGAANVSKILGRDVTDSFNRLVRGVTKAEPELLDELGITLRLANAKEAYATSLGKSANALTLAQQKQAVFLDVSTQLEKKFSRINEILAPENNAFAELAVKFDDAVKSLKAFTEVIASPVAKFFTNNISSLIAVLGLFAIPIIKTIIPSLENWREVTAQTTALVTQDIEEANARINALTSKKAVLTPGSPQQGAQNIVKNLSGRKGSSLEVLKQGGELTKRQIKSIIASLNKKTKTFESLSNQERIILKTNLEKMLGNTQTTFRSMTGEVANFAKRSSIEFLIFTKKAEVGLLRVKTIAISVFGTITKWVGRLLSIASGVGLVVIAFELLLIPFRKIFGKEGDADVKKQVKNFKDLADRQGKVIDGFVKLVDVQKELLKDSSFGADQYRALGNAVGTVTEKILDLNSEIAASQTELKKYEDSFNIIEPFNSAWLRELIDSFVDYTGQAEINKVRAEALAKSQMELARSGRFLVNVLKELGLDTTETAEAFTTLNTKLASGGKLTQKEAESYKKLAKEITTTFGAFGALTQQRIDDDRSYNKAISSITELDTKNRELLETLVKRLDVEQGLKAELERNNKDTKAQDEKIEGLKEQIRLIGILRNLEVGAALAKAKAEAKYQKGIRGASNFERDRLKRTKDISVLDSQILELNKKIGLNKEKGISVDSNKLELLNQQKSALEAQRDILKDQESIIKELDLVIKNTLEQSMSKNLADLIKGEESSFTDVILKISKAVFNSIADTLAKDFTEKLLSSVGFFKSPAQKMVDALKTGGDYVKQKIQEAFSSTRINANDGPLVDPMSLPPELRPSGNAAPLINANDGPRVDPMSLPPELRPSGNAAPVPPAPQGTQSVGFWEKLLGRKTATKTSAEELDASGNVSAVFEGGGKKGRTGGIFSQFINDFGAVFDKNAEGGFLGKMGNLFGSFGEGLGSLFKGLPDLLGGLFGGGGGFGSLIGGLFGFASGGIMPGGMKGYANGGVIKKPTMGMIGEGGMNEAVVPLPDGKSIPVTGAGGSQQNNISINVSMSSDGQSKESVVSNDQQGGNLGRAISSAVQAELQRQKRPGGILSPYGAA